MKKFITSYLPAIKAVFFILFGIVAVFVDIKRPWTHWTWLIFIVLIATLIGLEIFQNRRNKENPIEKLKRYFSDFDGWEKTESKDYYVSDPRFTISPTCSIPDDCIDKKRYPLFMARAVLKGLIASLQRQSGSTES